MASAPYPGTCLICDAPVTKRTAEKHLRSCMESAGYIPSSGLSFLIMVQDRYKQEYWLVLLARADATLKNLDSLLRDVWVECCGHLSAFIINNREYHSSPDKNETGMDISLQGVIGKGSLVDYEYDFGSTTRLNLVIIREVEASPEGTITVLARNNLPKAVCHLCGKEASLFCGRCTHEDAWIYCDACADQHICEADYLSSISNSPRCGICGSVGDEETGRRWYPAEQGMISTGEHSAISSEERTKTRKHPATPSENDILEDGADSSEGIRKIVDLITCDIGEEISSFTDSEEERSGGTGAALSREIVYEFCVFLYGIRDSPVSAWSPELLADVLMDEMARNPVPDPEWTEEVVPVLCRFLSHLEKSGRISQSGALITALKMGESDFIAASLAVHKIEGLAGRILFSALQKGIDLNDEHQMGCYIVDELLRITGLNGCPDIPGVVRDKDIVMGKPGYSNDEVIGNQRVSLSIHPRFQARYVELLHQCREFCDLRSDPELFLVCQQILQTLAAHEGEYITRGKITVFSAGVVYAACQIMGRIGRGSPDTGVARLICSFFHTKIGSARQKAGGIRSHLKDISVNELTL